jgi:hypothetical protein
MSTKPVKRYDRGLTWIIALICGEDLLAWLIKLAASQHGDTEGSQLQFVKIGIWDMNRPLVFLILCGVALYGMKRLNFALTGACWSIAVLAYVASYQSIYYLYLNYKEAIPLPLFGTIGFNQWDVIRAILLLIVSSWWAIETLRIFRSERYFRETSA